jgi:hypothetical protein
MADKEEEPDIKRENLADTDESPFGDTTEHAGEQDTDKGTTYSDPEGDDDDEDERETQSPPGGEDGAQAASYGEGEGTESVPIPDSERLANREDT